MTRWTWILAILALGVAGPVAVETESEAAADFNLEAYATYAWQAGTPAARRHAEKTVHGAVAHELEAAGLRFKDDGPDLLVATHVLPGRHTLEDLSDPDYWSFYTGNRSTDAYDLGGGTIVIDLIDASQEQRVWRGIVSRPVGKNMSPESHKIDVAIHKLLKRLRP